MTHLLLYLYLTFRTYISLVYFQMLVLCPFSTTTQLIYNLINSITLLKYNHIRNFDLCTFNDYLTYITQPL